jgi:hypothetical protein
MRTTAMLRTTAIRTTAIRRGSCRHLCCRHVTLCRHDALYTVHRIRDNLGVGEPRLESARVSSHAHLLVEAVHHKVVPIEDAHRVIDRPLQQCPVDGIIDSTMDSIMDSIMESGSGGGKSE